MNKLYSQTEAEAVFSSYGWKLQGTYVGALVPVLCSCPRGHIQLKRPNDLANYGCATCSGKARYTQEQIEEIFSKKGWKVTAPYINSDIPVKCECTFGHPQNKYLYDFNNNSGCSVCSGVAKKTIGFVKEEFKKVGYDLLSTVYINNRSKLEYKCNKGHSHSITWASFKNGRLCPFCVDRNIKYTYDFVKKTAEAKGYKLLSKEYKNHSTKMRCICSKGHNILVNFRSILSSDCYVCAQEPEKSIFYKGGVSKLSLPLYETYAHQLKSFQLEIPILVYSITQDGLDLLGVPCTYCGKVIVPTTGEVERRIAALKGSTAKENNIYCSENCKKACPTYHRYKYPKGHKKNIVASSREVSAELRKMVLARDGYKCAKCGKGSEETKIHCHHIDPVINNPIESADMDNCITYCLSCHKLAHKTPGCGYNELKCST